jgi:hypothetical protein
VSIPQKCGGGKTPKPGHGKIFGSSRNKGARRSVEQEGGVSPLKLHQLLKG